MRRFLLRLLAFFRSAHADAELNRELDAHLLVIDAVSGGEILSGQSGTFLPLMCIVMSTVALLASIGPARRGLRVQPTQALRDE